MADHLMSEEIAERPSGYAGPDLSPEGLELRPRRLADGVYALMATIPPKDNNGIIHGTKAALVVDAGITPSIGRRIRQHVAEVTDIPPRYLVNTTYHGDHTFGNVAFDDLTIVSSRANRSSMRDLEREKRIRSANMYGAEAEFDAITHWRLPDLVFDGRAEIDLGDQPVELHHFGPGNGPGDTVVYSPRARTAWTGNFLASAGSSHMLLQGGPEPYIASLRAMQQALPELETIVTGHGPSGDGHPAITALLDYLQRLRDDVAGAVEAGRTLDETYALATDPWADGLEDDFEAALAAYGLPAEGLRRFLELTRNLHRLNVMTTYRVYEGLAAS